MESCCRLLCTLCLGNRAKDGDDVLGPRQLDTRRGYQADFVGFRQWCSLHRFFFFLMRTIDNDQCHTISLMRSVCDQNRFICVWDSTEL